jgi:translation elongation factor EF-G
MVESREKYELLVPEDVIGDVCGEVVVARGGLIVAMDNQQGVFTVRTETPSGSMANFDSWFAKATSNRGAFRRLND